MDSSKLNDSPSFSQENLKAKLKSINEQILAPKIELTYITSAWKIVSKDW